MTQLISIGIVFFGVFTIGAGAFSSARDSWKAIVLGIGLMALGLILSAVGGG